MARRFTGLFLALLMLLTTVFACGGCSTSDPPSEPGSQVEQTGNETPQELMLYVAAGMKKPMDVVIEKFKQETGVEVAVNYGPSGGLWAQIQQGQPCDLYYSADWIYIEKAESEGKVAETLKFLSDNIVLAVSPTGEEKVKSVDDLTKEGVSFAIGDPQAPVGVYAEEGLKNLGLWEKVSGTLKARPSTVNQIAIMVKEDQVDAGLIYSSVANGNQLKVVQTLDEELTGEIVFGTAVIKGGNESLAKEFMDFAKTHVDEFAKYGWTPYV